MPKVLFCIILPWSRQPLLLMLTAARSVSVSASALKVSTSEAADVVWAAMDTCVKEIIFGIRVGGGGEYHRDKDGTHARLRSERRFAKIIALVVHRVIMSEARNGQALTNCVRTRTGKYSFFLFS